MTTDFVEEFLAEHDRASPTATNIQEEPISDNKKRKGAHKTEVSNLIITSGIVTYPSQANKKPKIQENRAIYITNLPRDTNEEEIEETFKKYGIIDQGADGKKRIKMYLDEEGNFNGEALIVYFKKDSIDLAIKMMDEYYFRIEDQSQGVIRVKEADFSYKRNKDGDDIASKLTRKDRKASERNRADLNR